MTYLELNPPILTEFIDAHAVEIDLWEVLGIWHGASPESLHFAHQQLTTQNTRDVQIVDPCLQALLDETLTTLAIKELRAEYDQTIAQERPPAPAVSSEIMTRAFHHPVHQAIKLYPT